MNTVQIIGNLTKDPVVRQTKGGKSVASFTVATNQNYTTPQDEKKQLTDYVNGVVWGPTAVTVGQQLNKGRYVYVQGRMSTRSYDDQQGVKHYITEVIASVVALPLQAPKQAYGQQSYSQNAGYSQPSAPQQSAPNWGQFGEQAPQQNAFGNSNPTYGPSGNAEDIPF